VELEALIRGPKPAGTGRGAPRCPLCLAARRRYPFRRAAPGSLGALALAALALAALALAVAGPTLARAEVLGTLAALEVRGNQAVDRELIVTSARLTTGSAVSRDDVKEALRKLYALGLFDDVDIYGEDAGPGQVRLIVDVAEKRRVGRIVFEGNKKIDDAGLKEKLTVKEGQIFDDRVLSEQSKALAAAYKEKGYSQVQIGSEVAPSEADGPGRVALTFTIDEGRKVKISEVRVTGIEGLDRDRLLKGIKTKKKGLLWGGDYKEEQLRTDLEKVTENLHNMGYKDAKEPVYTLEFDPDEPLLAIDIRVEPGPYYTMGTATWSGNTIIGTAQLERQVAWFPGDAYSDEKISTTVSNAYSAYAEEGYIYVNVEPRKTVTDQSVALEFKVTEGEPSMVRQVRVTGNTRTKEKVVRRQLVIRPGDRFSRTALVRSQREVFQLGFFEDVTVDFERAAQGTADIDIVFDVKEKQTGTLQAGAGFSSAGGLTGFIEMGHNNLFGNGQQLNLKIEAGGRSGQQDISFTEPWFRDTPTSVGFDLFNTRINRDYYDDRRRGGAIRMGRPLPWPDYTRGYLSYRLESVEISNVDPRSGAEPQSTTTSKVGIRFERNSTDNPFYPQWGSRVVWISEFAGSPFGGDAAYQKHVLDARTYVPTYWRPVLMLRARAGFLTGLGPAPFVPYYETFRLGGSTVYALRGYADYEVVPPANEPYLGGRVGLIFTSELQFLIAEPVHGLVFMDVGDTWNSTDEVQPSSLRKGAGIGVRLEIPLLGRIGFDYGFGFDRVGGARWEPHFLIGAQF